MSHSVPPSLNCVNDLDNCHTLCVILKQNSFSVTTILVFKAKVS